MRYVKSLWASLMLALGLLAGTAHATTIHYDITNVAGNQWRYDYTLSNDSLANTIDEFTIFFDLGLYGNLRVSASPAGWDSLVTEPDAGLPDDGFLDVLALAEGLAQDASIGGFSVLFDWLGQGTPGSQAFTVVDPNTIDTLDEGRTSPRQEVSVPEPSTLVLFALSLLGLGLIRRQGYP